MISVVLGFKKQKKEGTFGEKTDDQIRSPQWR
jgi:hypothetical protein